METEVTARLTGNAGVVIRMQNPEDNTEAAVGIDVFARDPNKLYPDTPPAIREWLFEEIEKEKLGILAFTHAHGDHFCLEDTLEALRRNPRLRVISTEETIRQIREREPSRGRLTAIRAGEKKYRRILSEGLELIFYNSVHMGEQYAEVQNLVCLLEAGGKRILLPGDAKPEKLLYKRAAAWSEEMDWLMGPFPLFGLPSSRREMASFLKLGHALALHLPRPEKDQEGWVRQARHVCETAADGLPKPIFCSEPGSYFLL